MYSFFGGKGGFFEIRGRLTGNKNKFLTHNQNLVPPFLEPKNENLRLINQTEFKVSNMKLCD